VNDLLLSFSSFCLSTRCIVLANELCCVKASVAQPTPTVNASQPSPTPAAAAATDGSRTSATNPPVCCLLNSQFVNN